jgi:hypothetical protein
VIGGICTLLAYICFAFYALYQAKLVYFHEKMYFLSKEYKTGESYKMNLK